MNSEKQARLSRVIQNEAFLWGDEVADAYHGAAASHMDKQWVEWIEPVLAKYPIDYSRTIDFAAGFGRNTRKLLEAGAGHVTMVDVNPDCIAQLSKNFPPDKATPVLNDGLGLGELDSDAYSFLYSFDAMVHFDLEVIGAYVPEFARVLQPGGYAFIHHSNYSGNPGGDFRKSPHWRNFMTADLFKHFAVRAGFEIVEQKLFDWEIPELDCLSILRKA